MTSSRKKQSGKPEKTPALGRSDRYPSDYGVRDREREEAEEKDKKKAGFGGKGQGRKGISKNYGESQG